MKFFFILSTLLISIICCKNKIEENFYLDYILPSKKEKKFVTSTGIKGTILYEINKFEKFTELKSKVLDSLGNLRHFDRVKIYNSQVIQVDHIYHFDTLVFPYKILDSIKYSFYDYERFLDVYNPNLKRRKILKTDTVYFVTEDELMMIEGYSFEKDKKGSFKMSFTHIFKKNFGLLKSIYKKNDSLVKSKTYY